MMFAHVLIKKVRKLVRCEQGGALAELAIMVPFLVLMLAVVSEIGRYFQTYTTLAKGTRSAARYLSNHSLNQQEIDRATNLVVCGKLTCASGETLIKGFAGGPNFTKNNVCIESATNSITVRVTRDGSCTSVPLGPAGNAYNYQPIFKIGALLGTNFNFALPLAPRTTMWRIPV